MKYFLNKLLSSEPDVSLYALWDSEGGGLYGRTDMEGVTLTPLFTGEPDAEEFLVGSGEESTMWAIHEIRGVLGVERFTRDVQRYTRATHYVINPPALSDVPFRRFPLSMLPEVARAMARGPGSPTRSQPRT